MIKTFKDVVPDETISEFERVLYKKDKTLEDLFFLANVVIMTEIVCKIVEDFIK